MSDHAAKSEEQIPSQEIQKPAKAATESQKDAWDGAAYRRADCCSQITFHWATRLVCTSFLKELRFSQVWTFPKRLRAQTAADRLFEAYERECAAHPVDIRKRSLKRALFGEFWPELIRPILWKCAWVCTVAVTASVCLRGLLTELSEGFSSELGGDAFPELDAVLYTIGFFCTESLRSLCHANFWWAGVGAGTRVRSAVRMLILRRTLDLSTAQKGSGSVLNFITNFSERLYLACYYGVFVISCPLTLLVAIGIAIRVIGLAALAGFALLLILAPIQFAIGKASGDLRRETIKITDERIGLMDEILASIKLIKLYAWEGSFARKTADIRDRERALLQKSAIIKVFNRAITDAGPALITAAMFGTHLAMTGETLSVAQTYTAITLFNICRFPLAVMPIAVRFIAEALVGLSRVNTFLNTSVTKRAMLLDDAQKPVRNKIGKGVNYAIDVQNVYCQWQLDSKDQDNIEDKEVSEEAPNEGDESNCPVVESKLQAGNQTPVEVEMVDTSARSDELASPDSRSDAHVRSGFLENVTLRVPEGSLLAVVGGVGAGKTSILEGLLLGHMKLTSGSVNLNASSVAYCAQTPWIFSATLRDNITFGSLQRTAKAELAVAEGTVGSESKSSETDETAIADAETRYREAVRCCCLEPDVAALPAGDATEIGERGINLSGGQKARVALGRAVFSRADIVLLDDPLSAVDAQVARHLFEECIGRSGTLMAQNPRCTRVLVTHQVQFLGQCDLVCIVDGGRIKAVGTFAELMERGEFDEETMLRQLNATDREDGSMTTNAQTPPVLPNSSALASEGNDGSDEGVHEKVTDEGPAATDPAQLPQLEQNVKPTTGSNDDSENSKSGKLTQKEHRQEGAVTCDVVRKYGAAMGPCVMGFLFIISFIFPQLLRILSDLWLLLWLEDGVNSGEGLNLWEMNGSIAAEAARTVNETGYFPQTYYYAVYVCVAIALALMAILQMSFAHCLMLRAGSALHDRVFRVVLRGTMAFFDTNPTGRILNKFGADMDQIDVQLPESLESVLTMMFFTLVTLVVISVVLPWFLVALAIVLIGYGALTMVFRKSVRQFKRMNAIAKSPLYTHVQNTVTGLATIAAYRRQDEYLYVFGLLADRAARAFFGFNAVSRWFGYRLDFLTTIIITSTALICILSPNMPAASAGLVITYALQTGGTTQYLTRLISEAEAYLTSVERLTQFEVSTPMEKSINGDGDTNGSSVEGSAVIPAKALPLGPKQRIVAEWEAEEARKIDGWPSQDSPGAIEFNCYSTRYRDGLPLVLKNVSFSVASGESVGIVGRTGSGKSSLTMALYRIIEGVEGSINIDGKNISQVPLHQLRSHLAIIPQDPVLFRGTVRSNLDPFDELDDSALWSVLEKVEMASFVGNLQNKLAAPVDEGGSNFSQGQRQLFCFARAILRRDTAVIVMDEATASVDNQTDDVVQKTIQKSFWNVTLLVIAHRLSTVMGCDKILALGAGEVLEYVCA
eukprot:INCI15489.3.p1 GENE.INCI15489.3~~INCI15489.3.p1  ORF type:complete len:1480 (-),score=235.88 INCI15489.3:489-4928(-)